MPDEAMEEQAEVPQKKTRTPSKRQVLQAAFNGADRDYDRIHKRCQRLRDQLAKAEADLTEAAASRKAAAEELQQLLGDALA